MINLNIGETLFYEKINVKKLNYILNNPSKYEAIIKEQEKDMRRSDKHYNAYAVFQKIKENVIVDDTNDEYGYLKITYNKGRNSNGIGRWYCNKGIGIQPLCVSVRHTICDGLWTDIDQVNSHPTIFKTLMNKYGFKSPSLDLCLNNREEFLQKVMKDEKCSRDTAKTMVISIINGSKYKSPTLKKLADEIKPTINHIIKLPEYKDIYDFVKTTYKDNIEGKTISRILQVIENNLLETYIKFFEDKGLITKYKDGYEIALIFDGFQLRCNDAITDELLDECRLYALEQTGYDIPLKVKPFDCCLDLPDDYNVDTLNDLINLIDKYQFGINNLDDKVQKQINDCISSSGSNASICSLSKLIFKETIVYDEEAKSWFYCNVNNVWNKCKSPYVYKGLLKTIILKLFTNILNELNKELKKISKDTNDDDEEDDDKDELKTKMKSLKKKIKSVHSICIHLQTSSSIDAVSKMAMIDFHQPKFYENKIDSKGNLFAFKNKVFDCKTLEIRPIKPDDYIMNNTGYDYPEYIDEDCKTIIEEYYKTIYPDEEVRSYMWYNDSFTLNGERTTQNTLIHTGSGSNSKSTKFGMVKSILGDYFCEVNADTFTKPPKTANSTSELYKAKGTRLLFFNEPDADDRLQTSMIKKFADGCMSKYKTRGLFVDAFEFPIFCRVECACNNKPVLSSCDGGVGRRIRVIDYPVKFISNPDVNNPNQALLNPEMNIIFKSNSIRNTYVRLLIDYFINISSKQKTELIPNKIRDDSIDYIEDSNPVLGFIMDKYIITNDTNDRIKSSEIFTEFKLKCSEFKMTSAKFKDNMLVISGIQFKKMKDSNYFIGLKAKDEFISN